MRKAINYTMNHWAGLTLFLTDNRVPLTNNDAERTLRHGVVGRKNFYGSKTINGADVAATLYTIIQSCQKIELEPTSYIRYAVNTKIQGNPPLTTREYARSIRRPQLECQ